jgi:hypothetical protein
VVPTEAGREGIAAAAGLLAETEADLAERLGKEKLDSLVALLEELSILLAQAKSSSGYRR